MSDSRSGVVGRARKRIQDLIESKSGQEMLATIVALEEGNQQLLKELIATTAELGRVVRRPIEAPVTELVLPETVRDALGLPSVHEDYAVREESVTAASSKTYKLKDEILKRVSKTGYVLNDGTANITLQVNRQPDKFTVLPGEKFEWGTGDRATLVAWEITIETAAAAAQSFRLHAW